MIFTSPVFLVFALVVLPAYWLLRGKQLRQDFALAASLVFYGWWDWRFLGLIGLVIAVAHVAALRMERRGSNRRWVLGVAVALMLGVLGAFKYFNFFVDSAAALLSLAGLGGSHASLQIILPVGISFYTFQAISYVVDVYRRELPAEPRLRTVAFYIAYFPQLVAGPIVRATEFLPQTRQDVRLDPAAIASGLRLFLLGFLYKAVFADNLAVYVDRVYGNVAAFGNEALVTASLGFYSQIYFDFSGTR